MESDSSLMSSASSLRSFQSLTPSFLAVPIGNKVNGHKNHLLDNSLALWQEGTPSKLELILQMYSAPKGLRGGKLGSGRKLNPCS